ncbi:MAG: phosphatidylserine synthase, partial [Lachnospiraceae bacterium]|nr:phosphatidylserine synthase [Lachnospiraceae bacterium]
IFPTILLLQYVLPFDISLLYYLGLVVTGTLFVSKIKVKKPGLKGILMMIAFGAVIGILLLVGMFAVHHIH